MTNLKVCKLYTKKYREFEGSKETYLDIFLAIVSCSTVATWLTQNSANYICAFIIVLSQVIVALKPALQMRKRIEALAIMSELLTPLFLEAEKDWRTVQLGHWSNEKINARCFELAAAKHDIEVRALGSLVMKQNDNALEYAEKKAESYFNSNYK